MSRFLDLARDVNLGGQAEIADWERASRPYRVVTVTSNKGGVGKTTIASNLAVYVRSIREDLPVLLVGFDDQATIDRMFALEPEVGGRSVAYALRAGTFEGSIREGRHGVHYVPSSQDVWKVKRSIRDPLELRGTLERTGWRGLILIDTKADLEVLTQSAIAASDLTIVVVKDQASLEQADQVYALLDRLDRPRETARVLLSLVNLRVKFTHEGKPDLLALLVGEIRRRGYPLFESFMSLSPKVESLHTNPEAEVVPIMAGAPDSVVHGQLLHVAHDLLKMLDSSLPAPSPGPAAMEAGDE